MDINCSLHDFQNWTPIRIFERDRRISVDWCYLGDRRFVQPFHDDTIEICLRQPFNQLFRRETALEFLGELYEEQRGIAPAGFIFHTSRCGSTLVSQMLAALDCNIVVSEASAIDKIVRADAFFSDVSDEQKAIWLRWLLNALAQPRDKREKHFFVKFDSWATLDLPIIERAFPNVPWIFMYRNPIEVVVSNLREPGAQMIPGAISKIFPDSSLTEILQFSIEERCARTIAAFCRAALDNSPSRNALFVNYSQLPEVVGDRICAHFNVAFDAEQTEKMRGAAKFHAKKPQLVFQPDAAQKRREASLEAQNATEKFVAPLYDELEKLRLNRETE